MSTKIRKALIVVLALSSVPPAPSQSAPVDMAGDYGDLITWGCHFSRSKTQISYHYSSVESRYQSATYAGREVWNDSQSVPRLVGTGGVSDVTIYDGPFSNSSWAWIENDPDPCNGPGRHVTKKHFFWNTRKSSAITATKLSSIAQHEFGHVYGLAHDVLPCDGVTIMASDAKSCGSRVTWRDYSAVHMIYG